MVWRWFYSSLVYCDDIKIVNGGFIVLLVNLYCREGCNLISSISIMCGKCIVFSVGEDWFLGEGLFLFIVFIFGI